MREPLRIPLVTQLTLTVQHHLQGLRTERNNKVIRESSQPAGQSSAPMLPDDLPMPHLFLLDMKIGR
jgi:hypothetical protein